MNTLIEDKFQDRSTDELLAVQRVYIEDYQGHKVTVDELGARIRNAEDQTAKLRRKLSYAVKLKVRTLATIDAIGRILDSRDGTIRAGA